MNKLLSSEELLLKCETLKNSNQRIVLAHGFFGFLHIGHIRFLQTAKSNGDVLIVTVSPDESFESNKFDQSFRANSLTELSSVDFVAVNDFGSIECMLSQLKPNLYVKGEDYADYKELQSESVTQVLEDEGLLCKQLGIEMLVSTHSESSVTDAVNSFFSSFSRLLFSKDRNEVSF